MSAIVAETEGFVKEHPYAAGGIALGMLLLLVLVLGGKKTTAQPTVIQAPDTSGTQAAAELGAAQIAANQSNTAATIAAGVQNTATAASLQLGLAQTNNATQIQMASLNDQTTLGVAQANAATAQSGNQAAASEFSNLAATLLGFATTQNTTVTNATQGDQIASVLNTATTANEDYFKTVQNDFYGSLDQSIAAATQGVTYDVGAAPTFGEAIAGGSSGGSNGVAGGVNASQLQSLFSGGGTTTTTALSGQQFSADFNNLTAHLGNGLTFHAA